MYIIAEYPVPTSDLWHAYCRSQYPDVTREKTISPTDLQSVKMCQQAVVVMSLSVKQFTDEIFSFSVSHEDTVCRHMSGYIGTRYPS